MHIAITLSSPYISVVTLPPPAANGIKNRGNQLPLIKIGARVRLNELKAEFTIVFTSTWSVAIQLEVEYRSVKVRLGIKQVSLAVESAEAAVSQ